MIKKLVHAWFVLVALVFCLSSFAQQTVRLGDLPQTAQQTVQLIRQNGPFPYEKDGIVFGNYERILPKEKRGYYHEYTVPTRGARGRGAQRIVVGGNPQSSNQFYYTKDHYATFWRILFSGR